MKTMCFYLTVVLELGFLAISSTALPLFSVRVVTKGPEAPEEDYNLKIAGILVNGSTDLSDTPRCGVTDIREFSTLSGQPTFDKKDLTYRVQQYTFDLAQDVVDDIVKKAFQLWADVTPLTFTQTTSPADIEIIFASNEHGDRHPFDGTGLVVAHAFGTGPEFGGDAHFDEDEHWTTGRDGINLFLVAAHEFGQSLGLDHSDDANTLMFPFFRYVETDGYKLSSDDVNRIQSLYGSAVVPLGPNPTQGPGPNPTERPSPCDPNLFMDAAVRISRNVFFFKNGYYKSAWSSQAIPVRNTWPSITSNIDAAINYHRRGQRKSYVIFFTGSQYWLFSGTVLNPGFPKPISDFGFPSSVTRIDAAMRVGHSSILFFVGDQFWVYNTQRNQLTSGPRLIRTVFKQASNVDAAINYHGTYYLTNGPNVHQYQKANLIGHFRPAPWMNCT